MVIANDALLVVECNYYTWPVRDSGGWFYGKKLFGHDWKMSIKNELVVVAVGKTNGVPVMVEDSCGN